MDVKLAEISTFASKSVDLSCEYVKSLEEKLDECMKYIEGIKQCLVYLTQEEADLNSLMLEGELEQNPDLLKCHSQTVSKTASETNFESMLILNNN